MERAETSESSTLNGTSALHFVTFCRMPHKSNSTDIVETLGVWELHCKFNKDAKRGDPTSPEEIS